ncbi:MAG TPA: host attachment protein [Opitutus sp.]|nr:host attachment protein [Opitutus sp.]
MNDHYIVTSDRGHLRIYAETRPPGHRPPRLDVVEALDFPAGRANYSAHDTDMAGRFPGSGADGRDGGMSIDERLPMKREEERRGVRLIASELDRFFATRREATWDLAIAPSLYNAIVQALSPATRLRLQRVLSKDLVNQTTDDVQSHFATAGR